MRIPMQIKKDNAVSEIIGFILIFVIVLSLFAGTVAVYVPAKATSAELGYQASTSDAMSQMLSDILNGNLQPNGNGITESFPMGVPGVFFSQAESSTVGLNNQAPNISLNYNISVAFDYPSSTPASLINNTIAKSITIPGSPVGIAVDTYNQNLYAISSGSSDLYEINSTSNAVKTISNVIGSSQFPIGITFDPHNDILYITVVSSNASLNGLIEFNTLTHSTLMTSLPNIPYDVSYDSSNNEIYVTTYFNGSHSEAVSGQVYAISTSSNSIVCEISIPEGTAANGNSNPLSIRPTGISYDPSNGLLYVSLHNGSNLIVINPVTNEIVNSLPIASSTDTAFDSANGSVYVTQSQTILKNGHVHGRSKSGQTSSIISNYSIINGVDNQVVLDTSFNGCPSSVVYDSSNHLVYMALSSSNKVSIFDGENNTFTGKSLNVGTCPGVGPNSMVFDPYNGYIYVANFGSGNISAINGHTVTLQSFNPTKSGLPTSDILTAAGEFYASAPTNFVQSLEFTVSDGMLVEQYMNNNSRGLIYGLPLLIQQNQLGTSLTANIMNIGGSSISESSTEPIDITLSETRSQQLNLTDGQQFAVGNYSSKNVQGVITAVIDTIIVNTFTYTINSTFSYLIDEGLYKAFNGTASLLPKVWQFNGMPFEVTLDGNILTMSLLSKIDLNTVSIKYYSLGISL